MKSKKIKVEEMPVALGSVERQVDGAVWIYPMFGYWCLKGLDGEILAEISGSAVSDIWTFKGKRYHELENAKKAAMRSLGAA